MDGKFSGALRLTRMRCRHLRCGHVLEAHLSNALSHVGRNLLKVVDSGLLLLEAGCNLDLAGGHGLVNDCKSGLDGGLPFVERRANLVGEFVDGLVDLVFVLGKLVLKGNTFLGHGSHGPFSRQQSGNP